ncbi:hypothetical protein AB6A40_005638 [Gnathostoma spinigerum]|uniref:Uncharacterized protein n=1 Tax=Gnathostoma spinigerum TaxID=75299 RepID=A0ABD6EG05_9BILA
MHVHQLLVIVVVALAAVVIAGEYKYNLLEWNIDKGSNQTIYVNESAQVFSNKKIENLGAEVVKYIQEYLRLARAYSDDESEKLIHDELVKRIKGDFRNVAKREVDGNEKLTKHKVKIFLNVLPMQTADKSL